MISGDDPRAAAAVAVRAGVDGADKTADLRALPEDADLSRIAEEYTVFGRVSPRQKRDLIRALQRNGHVACMTGDGVNDVLAMKEADCSVAMAGGSSAASSVSDFVLMSSDFSAMIHVLNEGRRVINNIEKISALYLVRTIYSVLLSVIYIFLPYAYPFIPVQMTVVNSLVVGIPTFFLAMRADTRKPEGKFADGVWESSFPASVTIVFVVLSVQAVQIRFGMSLGDTSTLCVFLIGAVGFAVLFVISRPISLWIGWMLAVMTAAYLALFTVAGFVRDIFSLEDLLSLNAHIYLPLLLAGPCLFFLLRRLMVYFRGRMGLRGRRGAKIV